MIDADQTDKTSKTIKSHANHEVKEYIMWVERELIEQNPKRRERKSMIMHKITDSTPCHLYSSFDDPFYYDIHCWLVVILENEQKMTKKKTNTIYTF